MNGKKPSHATVPLSPDLNWVPTKLPFLPLLLIISFGFKFFHNTRD